MPGILPLSSIAKCLTIAMTTLLCACSAVTVHLNTRYIDDTTEQQLTDKLEEAGFTVTTNTHLFPDSISQTSVVYSPLLMDPNAVDTLSKVLSENGFTLRSNGVLVEANQWYTKNNLGLYPIPDGMNIRRGESMADLAGQYQTTDCDSKGTLSLSSNGKFAFEFDNGNHKKGDWQIVQFPYLELSTPDYYRYVIEVQRYRTADKIGPISVTKLQTLDKYNTIDHCSFEAGLRD